MFDNICVESTEVSSNDPAPSIHLDEAICEECLEIPINSMNIISMVHTIEIISIHLKTY
jgi:hypothetical protein